MSKLKGKSVLITGASQGLGRQLAIDFAREGATRISIIGRRVEGLNEVCQRIQEIAPQTKVLAIAADLAQAEEVERVVAMTLREFDHRLDVLVNNAAAIGPTPIPFLVDYPLEDFRYVLNTNLIAPFVMIQKVFPTMVKTGGSIINVTSDTGVTGYPGWGAYSISKFSLEGMSQVWAAELEGSWVRLNWVDPGDMNTTMHRASEPEADRTRWAEPAKVTDVFIYLASDESQRVSGQRFQAQVPD
ncbi:MULTISPECIES: SDR family NAD(P)-dependent oxidoreductase [Nostoc]|uniref:SDR family oxidoreductase n=1 Tax=Nostoc punctiforme FACHB-252 TaxID=1357509 RepID=A0ABR8HJC2_NOSPU|nr:MULTISPECIES: SDR family oxidoreductase [Nostoc]MBC1238629.1 SDR family oxidoreductase [Nostoc sp. 2RC]MBD2615623.1 SDR family oxidoreductase [Nostoc punctiforme FACHB-252]